MGKRPSPISRRCLWPPDQGHLSARGIDIERKLTAVVTADPFMGRVTDSGVGYVASHYATFLPEGQSVILHAARRDWVQANPQAVGAFREAVQQGARFIMQPDNEATVRTSIGKYIRPTSEVLARMQIARPGVASVVDVPLAKPRDQLATREHPDFLRLRRALHQRLGCAARRIAAAGQRLHDRRCGAGSADRGGAGHRAGHLAGAAMAGQPRQVGEPRLPAHP